MNHPMFMVPRAMGAAPSADPKAEEGRLTLGSGVTRKFRPKFLHLADRLAAHTLMHHTDVIELLRGLGADDLKEGRGDREVLCSAEEVSTALKGAGWDELDECLFGKAGQVAVIVPGEGGDTVVVGMKPTKSLRKRMQQQSDNKGDDNDEDDKKPDFATLASNAHAHSGNAQDATKKAADSDDPNDHVDAAAAHARAAQVHSAAAAEHAQAACTNTEK